MRTLLLVLAVMMMLPAGGREYARFDVVGDSIAAGYNPDTLPALHGWAQMLFGESGGVPPATKEQTIYTLWPGIDARTSGEYASLASEWAAPGSPLLSAVLDRKPDLVVVMVGANDFFLEYTNDAQVTPEEIAEFRANLAAIVDRLQANQPRPDVILLTYYDLFDGYSRNLPFFFVQYRGLSKAAVDANAAIREVAVEKACTVVDLYPDFLHRCYGREFGDPAPLSPAWVHLPVSEYNIHPNTRGHERIYEKVYAALAELKAQPAPRDAAWADADQNGTIDAADLLLHVKQMRTNKEPRRDLLSFAHFWRMER